MADQAAIDEVRKELLAQGSALFEGRAQLRIIGDAREPFIEPGRVGMIFM